MAKDYMLNRSKARIRYTVNEAEYEVVEGVLVAPFAIAPEIWMLIVNINRYDKLIPIANIIDIDVLEPAESLVEKEDVNYG